MEGRIWAALLLVHMAAAAATATVLCPVPSAQDLILGPRDSCSVSDHSVVIRELMDVMEGDEVALQRALRIVHNKKEEYVAVLFHASWCPFSKLCRPNYETVSSMFPTIRHFAFEESLIRPSTLSRYGVHGFPTLFLLNSTMRVRYHGSRAINSLISFYTDVTGIKPVSLELRPLVRTVDLSNLTEVKEGTTERENCPFSWARSPDKLLQQDAYLALASFFVLMRLLHFVLPKLNACIKRAWRRHIRYASLMNMWDCSQAYLEQARRGLNRFNPCKRGNLQEGAMNAKAWASKSLASVSIGEPSSRRTSSMVERR